MSDTDIRILAKLEGLTFEEAKLAYAERSTLPATSFCGPSYSFPCHDVSCVRESFDKVSKERPEGWQKIIDCIKERCARFNIDLTGFFEAKTEDRSKLIDWYLKKINSENEENCEECGE